MRISPLLPIVTAAALAACAGRGGGDNSGKLTFAASLGVDTAAMTKTRSGAWYKDLETGSGPQVHANVQVAVHYDGRLPDGTRFDANGPGDQPFAFRLGVGDVVTGFDEGVDGMRVGGRRLVVIPPNLGYGAGGSGPIPPNSYLVFTIQLVDAR